MKEQPILTTKRLILRPYSLTDAKEVQRLIGDRDVVDTLLNVPYPYEDGMAEDWISKRQGFLEENKSADFAITDKEKGFLIGGIGIMHFEKMQSAEIGYWIAKSYWHKGYCTEAAQVLLKYGFETLGLNRIYAMHMTRNPHSGKVMQKIG